MLTAPHVAPSNPHNTILLHQHASMHSHITILLASLLLHQHAHQCATCITTLAIPHVASVAH
jgi:hypothetical protein